MQLIHLGLGLVRRFARQYELITRPERLRTVARDLVRHFVGRGFAGTAMYVGIDKAAAVRMFDLAGGAVLRTIAEIIDNDEDFAVEFKSTARWDINEQKQNKAMEDAVVKTIAAFLNTDGGTLLTGVAPDCTVIGLGHDYPLVKPTNGDGFVNWLTTHLNNAIGHAAVMRTRARIALHEGHEICRLDVARSTVPVWARTSKEPRVFFARMNNSSRPMPDEELAQYLNDHWPGTSAAPPFLRDGAADINHRLFFGE